MKVKPLDKTFLLALLFMLGLGLVQVYSSSYIFAIDKYGDGFYFVSRQLLYTVLALGILFGVALIPWRWIERYGFVLCLAAVVGLGLTLVSGAGIKAGGAHRWLRLPMGFRFEPGELFKISLPLLLATLWCRDRIKSKYELGFKVLLVLLPMLLLLKQPDFGSFAICSALIFALLFAFGLQWRYVFGLAAAALPAFYVLVVQVPYRFARVKAFLNPWADPREAGFQIIQSMTGFSNGGFWGVGLGQGHAKLFFLPEAHTDFTLAVFAEEWGFIGVAFVLLLFGYLIYRGLQISFAAKTSFQKTVALGVTVVLGLSILINAGVVMGLLPTKGLTMPFLSYGGSSLLCCALGFGLLLNIDRHGQTDRGRRK